MITTHPNISSIGAKGQSSHGLPESVGAMRSHFHVLLSMVLRDDRVGPDLLTPAEVTPRWNDGRDQVGLNAAAPRAPEDGLALKDDILTANFLSDDIELDDLDERIEAFVTGEEDVSCWHYTLVSIKVHDRVPSRYRYVAQPYPPGES